MKEIKHRDRAYEEVLGDVVAPNNSLSLAEMEKRRANGQPLSPDEPDPEFTVSFETKRSSGNYKAATIAITGTAAAIAIALGSIYAVKHHKKTKDD